MSKKEKFTFEHYSGKKATVEINHTINLEDFRGTPGYALLVLAANRHLSIDVLRFYLLKSRVERGRGWVYRRRWLFEDPDTVRKYANPDGNDAHAVALMRENTELSLRQLSRLLSHHGIRRGKDWVRQHRCD